MKNRKLLAAFIVFFMTVALFVPSVAEAYGYRRTYAPRLGEARQNEEFIRWQNQQNYGNYGVASADGDDYEGLVPEPAKIYFGRPRAQRFERLGFPATYDLRDYNKVSEIRDQGPNGSCWAFATYGSMESILLRQKKGKFDFSEKHLRNMHGFDWSAEKGGNRDMAAAYLASGKGPIAEDDDPYDPVITVSPKGLRRQLDMDKVIYLPDVTNINEVDNLKWAISEYGGVYTTINSSSYYENKKTFTMYNPGRGTANHAVTIVGWDDTYPSTAFTQRAPGNGAWICKNSWGSKYMDSGYYYVSYYDAFVGKKQCYL